MSGEPRAETEIPGFFELNEVGGILSLFTRDTSLGKLLLVADRTEPSFPCFQSLKGSLRSFYGTWIVYFLFSSSLCLNLSAKFSSFPQ